MSKKVAAAVAIVNKCWRIKLPEAPKADEESKGKQAREMLTWMNTASKAVRAKTREVNRAIRMYKKGGVSHTVGDLEEAKVGLCIVEDILTGQSWTKSARDLLGKQGNEEFTVNTTEERQMVGRGSVIEAFLWEEADTWLAGAAAEALTPESNPGIKRASHARRTRAVSS